MLKAQARPVHLYMEANPNPNSLKFVANFVLVDEAVFSEEVFLDVQLNDLANNEIACAAILAQLYDLLYYTFELNRCFGHPKWFDFVRSNRGKACFDKFIDARRIRRAGQAHLVHHWVIYHIDYYLWNGFGIVESVFGLTSAP